MQLLIYILMGGLSLHALQEMAAGGPGTPMRSEESKKACRAIYDDNQCADYFKAHPENAKNSVNCDAPPPYAEGFKKCGAGVWNLVKSVGSLLTLPEDSPERKAQLQYYDKCAQSMDCKRAFWNSLRGSPPNEAEEKRLAGLTRGHALDVMAYAKSRQDAGERTEQVRALMAQPQSAERDARIDQLIPGWKDRDAERTQALWFAALEAAKNLPGEIRDDIVYKPACYNGAVQAEAVCVGVAVILGTKGVTSLGARMLATGSVEAAGAEASVTAAARTAPAAETAAKSAVAPKVTAVTESVPAYRVPVVAGDSVAADHAPFPVPKDSQVHTFGSGGQATAYRVEPPSDKPFINKLFSNPETMEDEEARMRALHEAADPNSGFRVASVIKTRGSVLSLEDSRGTPLDKLLRDPRVPDQMKEQLRQSYNDKLKALAEKLKQKFQVLSENPDVDPDTGLPASFMSFVKQGSFNAIKVFIKPSNVIVGEDLSFSLADGL